MSASLDLTVKEQTNVRAALAFLRLRCGGWGPLAKVLRFKGTTLSAIRCGDKIVSPTLAFRIARVAKVGVDEVLTGKFPEPGTCAHCGHRAEESTARLEGPR
jgi:hypothetical protein